MVAKSQSKSQSRSGVHFRWCCYIQLSHSNKPYQTDLAVSLPTRTSNNLILCFHLHWTAPLWFCSELFLIMMPNRIQPLPYCTSFLPLLFTNILQSHGVVMTQYLWLPLSLAVARTRGVSCFDNSMLTQVRMAVFQLKKGRALFGGYFRRTCPGDRNWLL